MRRYLYSLLCSLALAVSLAAIAPTATTHAVDVFGACSGNAASTDVCKDKGSSEGGTNPVITALKVTITIMAFVIGFTSIIIIIVSGINMIMSGGDPQKVASARSTLIYAVVGVAIAVAAESIVAFVLNKL